MAGQDTKRVVVTYDEVAREYAEKFVGEHEKKPMDQEMLRRFAREVGDASPIWELGCGPGYTAAYLKRLGVAVSGLDLSREMVTEAGNRHPDIHFQEGNLLFLDFEESSIAGAVAFYAIVHFSDEQTQTALREIFRVLRPGAIFLFTYHIGDEILHVEEFLGKKTDIDFMFFTTAFICDCLRDIGFVEIEATEREPYPDVEYESRRAYVFARKPAP